MMQLLSSWVDNCGLLFISCKTRYEACLTNIYLRTNQLWKMEKLQAPRGLFHATSKNKIIPSVRSEFLQGNFTI